MLDRLAGAETVSAVAAVTWHGLVFGVGLRLVSRDVADFAGFGEVRVESWWRGT